MNRAEKALLQKIIDSPICLETARKAVEDVLVDFRNNRISIQRNNGCVIREENGEASGVIRLSIEQVIQIGLKAIIEEK
jgi:hypothetical protein